MPAWKMKTIAALAVVAWLGAARPVAAHAVGAECTLRDDRVEVEAYYDDDTPAGNARVTVQDEALKEVAQGRTDSQGRWSFPRLAPGKYRVTVDAGAGHRTTVTMTVPLRPAGEVPAANDPEGESDRVSVSEGPGRAEFTSTPWWKIAVGLGAIGGLGLAAWWALRRPGRDSPSL